MQHMHTPQHWVELINYSAIMRIAFNLGTTPLEVPKTKTKFRLNKLTYCPMKTRKCQMKMLFRSLEKSQTRARS